MVFSSPIFLFAYLPVVLSLYFLIPFRLRNGFLLLASLFFYAWGDAAFALCLVLSIVGNYAFGVLIERAALQGRPRASRRTVTAAIGFNLAMLIGFKYANFLVNNLSACLGAFGLPPLHLAPIHLPIGISFFAFQAMSYVIDVYRGDVHATRSLVDFGMYKSFFPQLIAGPIVRYRDVAAQIVERRTTSQDFIAGMRRFIIGLGKKVLIANSVAGVADHVFGLKAADLTAGLSWLGAGCYAIQIYFDFSGYSDMAIGMGRMFGFRFLENFNYPYGSRSIREFWRRWHISLSTWFRDYLYIPLGGNRGRPLRVYANLIVVFFLCGLWHGASWTFVVWGLWHGLFLVLERLGFGRQIERMPAPFQHAYALVAVLIGWVFFRAESLPYAVGFVKAMFGFGSGNPSVYYPALFVDRVAQLALLCGLLFSVPAGPALDRAITAWLCRRGARPRSAAWEVGRGMAQAAALALIFVASAMELAVGTYNPFIYFRF